MSREDALSALADRWRDAPAKELANAQSYVIELCEALGVERPRPSGSGYEFEFAVRIVNRDGTESANRVDLFKEGHFLLEAKDMAPVATGSSRDDSGLGPGSPELRLRRAFGQASSYAAFVPGGPPPYLMVLDVGRTLRLWDRWAGGYGGFQGAVRTIDLTRLARNPADVEFLRLVWENPKKLDPNVKSAEVTREIATKLAKLAARLEATGEDQERVARFLIRCVFTMFAEDVGLLRDHPFTAAVEKGLAEEAVAFEAAVEGLWGAMDEGLQFGVNRLLRFNGHFFHDRDVIALDRDALAVLLEAARADWAHVEPSIFGTLLTRALDREERHRLGAEFTPRAYVERLVRPTIEEPVRERWTLVQAEVLQLREHGTAPARKKAVERLRSFHDHLRSIRVLDPACGSGNFLYVSLNLLKEIELEVTREIEEITGQKEHDVDPVGPHQFHGIEVKLWAREVAELCLWVGYHQWWKKTHQHTQPPEPVLQDTGTLEHRDAVLAWDEIREVPEKSRPDPTPRIRHPVTGELVPDPEARRKYFEYVGARQAEWPEADFIVGNPPYIGKSKQRDALGDGYVDAIRTAYPDLPDTADYVMYWWWKGAQAITLGRAERAGLITTKTITQSQNRVVIEAAQAKGTNIVWAVRTHPWIDEADAAAVAVSMTVLDRRSDGALLVEVGEAGDMLRQRTVERLNADLSAHADVATAAQQKLLSNNGLALAGFQLYGDGFVLSTEEGEQLRALEPKYKEVVKPFMNGRDVTSRPRNAYVIDFGFMPEEDAREFEVPFDIVRTHVKPHRDANARDTIAETWWQFGWPRRSLREALTGLERFIVTPETAKHRFFTFLDIDTAPDNMLTCIPSDDAFHLGVLSSSIHVTWTLAAGGALETRPRYTKTKCFDPFPFPDPARESRREVAAEAERLDAHRKAALARDDVVTMTGMYNVVEKLGTGEALTETERRIHETAACGVLRDLHDELDRLVADAYGWPWPMETDEILARLVALHDERVEEERHGLVRWLRPDYQIPRFGDKVEGDLALVDAPTEPDDDTPTDLPDWPDDPIEQLTALRAVVAEKPRTVEQAARRFKGAVRAEVEKHFEALEVLGVVAEVEEGKWQARSGVGTAAGG